MFCPKCGNPIPEGNSFCGKCGATVEEKKPIENQFTEIVYNPESDNFTPVIPVVMPAQNVEAPAQNAETPKTDDAVAKAAAVHGVAPSQIQPAKRDKSKNTKNIIIICACVLLVIAIAVVGVIFFVLDDDNKPSGGKDKDGNVVDLTETTTQAVETTVDNLTTETTTEEPTTEEEETLDSNLFGVWQTVEETNYEVETGTHIKLKTYIAIRFKENGEFDMVINQDATVQAWLNTYYKYFADEKGLSKEEVDVAVQAAYGMSLEDAFKGTVQELANRKNTSGTWRTNSGTLSLVLPDGTESKDFYSATEKDTFVYNGVTYNYIMNLDGTIPE